MYTYNIRSVVGVHTPVGVVTEWLWSVHSKLECTLRQGKGNQGLLHLWSKFGDPSLNRSRVIARQRQYPKAKTGLG